MVNDAPGLAAYPCIMSITAIRTQNNRIVLSAGKDVGYIVVMVYPLGVY